MTEVGPIEVRLIGPTDGPELGALFERLAADEGTAHYHPHPLTTAYARALAEGADTRRDLYFVADGETGFLGYGMLRGWDEGYKVPSFGVAVDPDARGRGVARRLLRFAILLARERCAPSVILKVLPSNPRARALYESEGFEFEDAPGADGEVRGRLTL